MPQWKCEIKHFAYKESLQLIYLGEQISLFIALYVFVLFWDSSLHSSFFSQQNSKYGEREMEYIFAISDGGCFITMSSY